MRSPDKMLTFPKPSCNRSSHRPRRPSRRGTIMGDEKPSPDDVKGDPLACSSQVDDGDDDAGEEDEEYEDFGPIHEVPLPALPPTPLLVASSRATHLHHPETQLDQRHKRLRFDTFARVPPLYILPHRPDHHEVFRKDGKTPAWLPEHLLSTGWLTLFCACAF